MLACLCVSLSSHALRMDSEFTPIVVALCLPANFESMPIPARLLVDPVVQGGVFGSWMASYTNRQTSKQASLRLRSSMKGKPNVAFGSSPGYSGSSHSFVAHVALAVSIAP